MSYDINGTADIKWIQYESLNDTMNSIRSNPNSTQAVCLVLGILPTELRLFLPLDVDLPHVSCSRVSYDCSGVCTYVHVYACMCICLCMFVCVSMSIHVCLCSAFSSVSVCVYVYICSYI